MFHAIGEQHHAHAIVVAHCRHREDGAKLRRQLTLETPNGAEPFGPRQVDGEHDRQLALLDVALDERLAHAGRHVPIDGTHLVAGEVLSTSANSIPCPLKTERYSPLKSEFTSPRAQLDELDLPEDFGRDPDDDALSRFVRLNAAVGIAGRPLGRWGSGIESRRLWWRAQGMPCPRRRLERHRGGLLRFASSRQPDGSWAFDRRQDLATTSSLVTSSASASYVVSTRCRSTSGAMAFTSSGVTNVRPRRNA